LYRGIALGVGCFIEEMSFTLALDALESARLIDQCSYLCLCNFVFTSCLFVSISNIFQHDFGAI